MNAMRECTCRYCGLKFSAVHPRHYCSVRCKRRMNAGLKPEGKFEPRMWWIIPPATWRKLTK